MIRRLREKALRKNAENNQLLLDRKSRLITDLTFEGNKT